MSMSMLSRIGEKFGFSKSDKKRQAEMLEEVASRKRKCHDGLETLKERINLIENRARKKKAELDATKGQRRRIVVNEVKQLLRELDKLGGQEKILLGQLNKLSTLEAKISEVQVAGELAVAEDMVDDIAVDLEDAHDKLVSEDEAVRDLEKIGYDGFEEEAEEDDLDARFAEFEKSFAEEQTTSAAPQTEKAPEDDIPDDIQKRLSELEE